MIASKCIENDHDSHEKRNEKSSPKSIKGAFLKPRNVVSPGKIFAVMQEKVVKHKGCSRKREKVVNVIKYVELPLCLTSTGH